MNFDELLKSAEETKKNIVTTKKKYEKDTRFWKPTVGEDKKSSAKIRFLYPVEEGMEKPYAEFHKYGFTFSHGGKKRWYIQKSRKNIGKDEKDPVYDLTGRLYANDKEMWKTYVSKMSFGNALKRVANILVVSDPANPANNGKVFLYQMPRNVFTKIEEAMEPQDEFTEAFNPFHPLNGADMIVKSFVGSNGITDYSNSSFQQPSKLEDGDQEKIMEILNKQHSLKELMTHDDILPYDELKKKLMWVLGDDIPEKFFSDTPVESSNTETNSDIEDLLKETDNETSSSSDTMDVLDNVNVSSSEDVSVDKDIDAMLAELEAEIDQ